MTRLDGIDVSHYQGSINWPAVHAAGLQLAACKVTQGTTNTDPTFNTNRAGMLHAGVSSRLLYHWLTAEPAADQAAHFLAMVGTLIDGEGVILDVEDAALLDVKQAPAARAAEWCEHVEQATGRPVMIYTGALFDGGRVWRDPSLYTSTVRLDPRSPALAPRGRILAAYIAEAKARSIAAPQKWDVWQWTDKATVAGVPTPCDGLQLDNPSMIALACHGTAQLPPPVNTPPPVPAPIPEVPPVTNTNAALAIVGDARWSVRLLVGTGGVPEWITPERRDRLVADGVPQIVAKAHPAFLILCKLAGVPAELTPTTP